MAFNREAVTATAEKLVARGKIEGAIKEYRKLVADNPSDAMTINRLGDLYVDQANRDRGRDTVQVTADERLNAVIVNAPPADVRAIKSLVARLDGARPATVVEIKYIPLTSANRLETVSLIENASAPILQTLIHPVGIAAVIAEIRPVTGRKERRRDHGRRWGRS